MIISLGVKSFLRDEKSSHSVFRFKKEINNSSLIIVVMSISLFESVLVSVFPSVCLFIWSAFGFTESSK